MTWGGGGTEHGASVAAEQRNRTTFSAATTKAPCSVHLWYGHLDQGIEMVVLGVTHQVIRT